MQKRDLTGIASNVQLGGLNRIKNIAASGSNPSGIGARDPNDANYVALYGSDSIQSGRQVAIPASTQTLTAGTAVDPTQGKIIPITSSSAISTTIAATGLEGQKIELINIGSYNITLSTISQTLKPGETVACFQQGGAWKVVGGTAPMRAIANANPMFYATLGTATIAYPTAAQNQLVNFSGNVLSDSNSWYNSSNGRYIPQDSGWYLAGVGFYFASSTNPSRCRPTIVKNGTSSVSSPAALTQGDASGTGVDHVQNAWRFFYLNGTTDYLNAQFWADQTGTIGVSSFPDANFFIVSKWSN